jgi:thiamine biosynthesis lipoprotein
MSDAPCGSRRDRGEPRRLHLLIVLAFVVGLAPAQRPAGVATDEYTFTRDGVLGTSMRLVVAARTASEAQKLEADVLGEIERVGRLVSTWQADGELAQAIAGQAPVVVSPELAELIAACDDWRERTQGAFEPGVGALATLWDAAAKSGRVPAAAELAAATAALRESPWQLDAATRTLTVLEGAQPSVDALAKGFVIERASALRRGRYARVLVLEIGGDLRVRGGVDRAIAIADPRQPADNATPLALVHVTDGAVASSGGYARGFDVAGIHHSHIFDPRSGMPCDEVLGATAIAGDATSADALATILCVLGPTAGIAFVDGIEGAAGLVVTRDRAVHASARWERALSPATPKLEPEPSGESEPATGPREASPWPPGFSCVVQLEVRDPNAGGSGSRRGGYRRPYVAVWIERPDGVAVRTLALWIERTRWLPDLRRWYRLHRGRDEWIAATSRATRKPGSYELAWDGLDDDGHAVAPGEYVVMIEATREHGTYQVMRQRITIGTAPFSHALEGNEEIAGATVRFGAGQTP